MDGFYAFREHGFGRTRVGNIRTGHIGKNHRVSNVGIVSRQFPENASDHLVKAALVPHIEQVYSALFDQLH